MLFSALIDVLQLWTPIVVAVAAVALILVFAFTRKKQTSTRELTMIAVAVALSFALSYVSFSFVSNGGSVTLASYVPLFLVAYAYGIRKGLLASLAFSLLQMIQGFYFVSLFQLVLDYILPFTLIGLAAILKPLQQKLQGYDMIIVLFLIYFVRYFSHVISGVLYWEVPFVGSLIYSATYVPADFAICAVVLICLLATKHMDFLLKQIVGSKPKPVENTPQEQVTSD